LAALARPFLRSQSTAASTSPLVSASAVLQSIMPAPVLSRSSLTIAAVILAISSSYRRCGTARHRSARPHHVPDIIMPPKRHGIATRSRGLDQGAGERHPAVALDAAVELELGIELGDVGLTHGG